MSANNFAPTPRVFSRYRFLLFAAVLFTFLLVVMGTHRARRDLRPGLPGLADLLRQFCPPSG